MGWMHEECLIREALGRQRKKMSKERGQDSAPWEGFLEGSLKIEPMGSPMVEFTGDRGGVVGGVKTWAEPVECLLCETRIR